MKAENTQTEPKIESRDEGFYLGIRTVTPFKGMSAVIETTRKELAAWVSKQKWEEKGKYLLRFHVIDMNGFMDVEVGIKTDSMLEGSDRVRPATLPKGRYATLVYRGSGRLGHHTLLVWIRNQGLSVDVDEMPEGDHFACRYETFLTDSKEEPRKLLRDIELAIKIRD